MKKTVDEYIKELFDYRSRSIYTDEYKAASAAVPNAIGYLLVGVTHSRGTFPVTNALVTVSNKDNNFYKVLRTDESGKTEKLALQSVSLDASEAPGTAYKNVAEFYNIKIDSDEFVSMIVENIPVFEGITTVQNFDLTFKGASPDGNTQIITLPTENTL